jgi:tetratricopeptide (TPR) repeat protein
VRGADWSVTAYTFDFRPAAQAWGAAVRALHEALDGRFGEGRGLVVAMLENFDVLAKNLFGAETLESSKHAAKGAAIERRAAEERLREFMGRKGARFMLIATATGTVDLDYERPLFLAFKSIDLHAWDGDTCIEYFNKRRKLAGVQELTTAEAARARAIAEFIGGNPRLAQLLADVLNVPDARTIAQTLDALSDHLADYYRRRLDDLPANAAGLLDALIRTGEPCSQTELAERVGAQQNQIADAFSYLVDARLLSAARERDGRGTLYRVRDRLFVHFYRRRYGDAEQSVGLAPIVELLATFFSAKERDALARRHLEAGEFAEARLFRRLERTMEGSHQGYSRFRDRLVTGARSKLWELAGLTPDEVEPARWELRDDADKAYKRWGDAAGSAPSLLQQTTAKLLQAVAASRLDQDGWAKDLLEEALRIADTDVTTDARILTVEQMAFFSWDCLKDQKQALEQLASLQEWADATRHDYPKICAHLGCSLSSLHTGYYQKGIQAAEAAANLARATADTVSWIVALRYKADSLGDLGQHEAAIAVYEEAATLAQQVGDVGAQATCLGLKAWSLGQLGQHEAAIAVYEEAATLAQQAGDVGAQAWCLGRKAWSLGQLGQHEAAIAVCEEAAPLAAQAGDVGAQARCLRHKAWSLGQLERTKEAITAFDQAAALAREAKDPNELSRGLGLKSDLLRRIGQLPAALETVRAAMAMADQGVNLEERQWVRELFFQIAAQTPAPDVIAWLTQVLGETATDDRWFDTYLGDVMAAVTRAEAWAELQVFVREHAEWFANTESSLSIFDAVGTVWTDDVETRGRAETFAIVARDLPVIADVMKRMPPGLSEESSDSVRTHLRDLVAGIVSKCADAGFLRDLSHLVVEVFGADAEDEAKRLRSFADFHAAADKEKVLQRFDPDLAKAIRRMWNLPEPEDLLARRGRPRGR